MLHQGHTKLLLGVFVDDLIIAANDMNLYNRFAKDLKAKFQLSSEGSISNFLGVSVCQDLTSGTIKVDQAAYIESTLQRFGFSNSNDSGVSTPMVPNQHISKRNSPETNNPEHTAHFRAVVGSLLYLANWTCPEICFAVGELSNVLANPRPVHLW